MDPFNEEVSVEHEKKGEVILVRLKGRIDALTSPQLEKKIFDIINAGGAKLVLNLAGIDYMSSAGMRTLLSISKKLKSVPGRLVICSLTQTVTEILKMSGFDQILEIVGTEEEGLHRF